jgi:hypothetical protein
MPHLSVTGYRPGSAPGSRSRPLRWPLAAGFALGLLLVGCGRLNEKPPQAVDLSGDWQLRQSLSDDAGALLEPPRHRQRQTGTAPERDEGPLQDRRDGGPDVALLRNLLAQPAELSITQLPRELRLTADGSPTRYVYGQEAIDSVQGGVAERHAGWEERTFVIKYEVRKGPHAIRRYEKDPTGHWLTVTTRVSGGGGPKLEINTVYERKPGG